jgi:tetratricopeptide (TPR) repeat protein
VKPLIFSLALVVIFTSCNNDKKKIVDTTFADSLLSNYTTPVALKSNADEASFWKNRIDPKNSGFVNETKYAAAKAARFVLTGDINDLIISDSVLKKIDEVYGHKEAGPVASLAVHAITQHRFKEADSLLTVAKKIGLKPFESLVYSFDVDFESGRYDQAALELNSIRSSNDYPYYFRKSKLEHYRGNLDTSIASMLKAADLAGTNDNLKQAALTNAADLYIHAGKLKEAYELYKKCITLNPADMHSISGIGWIALVHDKNDSLAQKIFEFVHTKTKLPDPLFKLAQTAEARGDSNSAKIFAKRFVRVATDTAYGNMYNKYLVELFTGILDDPAKAEMIARKELLNRATPQTYAWFVWTLFANHKQVEAYRNYEKYVSGKPLEGLELYYMGKLMQGLKKGYNAKEFFKAAYKNKYDLSPAKIRELEKYLEE